MAKFEQILYGVAERVATITFNRPERLNAWTHQMEHEVHEAVDRAAADDAVRAIVLTGAGRGFCAGADMEGLSERAKSSTRPPAARAPESPDNFAQRYSYLAAVPKPVIAGINGPAAGIGFVLTLFCDIRYMAEGAKLSTSFARRGLIAEHGSDWMLPRLVGTMHALDLLMSARTSRPRSGGDESGQAVAGRGLPTPCRRRRGSGACFLAALDAADQAPGYKRNFQTLAEATAPTNAETHRNASTPKTSAKAWRIMSEAPAEFHRR